MCLDNHQSSVLSIFLISVTFSKGIINMANIRVSFFSEWPYLVAIHRFITIKFLARYQESIFAFSEHNLCCNSSRSEVLLESLHFLTSQENYLHFVALEISLLSSHEPGNYNYHQPDQSSSRPSNRLEIHFNIIFPFMPKSSVVKIRTVSSCLVVPVCAVVISFEHTACTLVQSEGRFVFVRRAVIHLPYHSTMSQTQKD